MKISRTFVYNENQPIETNLRRLEQDTLQLFEAFKGRIRFGTAEDEARGENLSGEFRVITSGAANTEFTVTHSIKAVPVGYLVLRSDKGGVVYDSGTAWTSSAIYLKCTTETTTVTLFLLK